MHLEQAEALIGVKPTKDGERSEGADFETPKDSDSNNSEKVIRAQPATY